MHDQTSREMEIGQSFIFFVDREAYRYLFDYQNEIMSDRGLVSGDGNKTYHVTLYTDVIVELRAWRCENMEHFVGFDTEYGIEQLAPPTGINILTKHEAFGNFYYEDDMQ